MGVSLLGWLIWIVCLGGESFSPSFSSSFYEEQELTRVLKKYSRNFIFLAIDHLFCTTYENSDDMTISSLLTYLNAAMPPDKHEDFDTSEVVKAVAAFKEKGKVIFEGDTLRLVD